MSELPGQSGFVACLSGLGALVGTRLSDSSARCGILYTVSQYGICERSRHQSFVRNFRPETSFSMWVCRSAECRGLAELTIKSGHLKIAEVPSLVPFGHMMLLPSLTSRSVVCSLRLQVSCANWSRRSLCCLPAETRSSHGSNMGHPHSSSNSDSSSEKQKRLVVRPASVPCSAESGAGACWRSLGQTLEAYASTCHACWQVS